MKLAEKILSQLDESTRSMIGIKNKSGSVLAIYCHFDGNTNNVGAMLKKFYKTPKKINALMDLGSISFLEKDIEPRKGVEHSFNSPVDGVTVAYHRDRGERKQAADKYSDANRYASKNRGNVDYLYMYDTGNKEWLVYNDETEEWVGY